MYVLTCLLWDLDLGPAHVLDLSLSTDTLPLQAVSALLPCHLGSELLSPVSLVGNQDTDPGCLLELCCPFLVLLPRPFPTQGAM